MALFIGGLLDPIIVNSKASARLAANQIHQINMVRMLALIEACKIAVRIDYDSADQALSTMELIADKIDAQLLKLGNEAGETVISSFGVSVQNPEAYVAMENLRQTFIKSMKNLGASLAKIVNFEVPSNSISTLELTYDKYKDITREDIVFKRNKPLKAIHPGFMNPGNTVEILSE
jgi:prophage DNA circulation protein